MIDDGSGLLITGGSVGGVDGRFSARDVRVEGGRIVARSERPPGRTIAAAGSSVVPLVVETVLAQRGPVGFSGYDLTAGKPATFAVVHRRVTETEIRRMLVVAPRDLVAVVVDGGVEAIDGRPVRAAGVDLEDPTVASTWIGTWRDPGRGLDQHLLPNGRYSETRGGRADAYTGRFWVSGGRITYLDDSGFWAFGELLDGVLHHAGFVMSRS